MPIKSLLRTNEETGEEEVYCPRCAQWWPRDTFEEFTVVPRFSHLLTPVYQCRAPIGDERECRHIFAITELALIMRQHMALGTKTEL